jgi:hypothetical protein
MYNGIAMFSLKNYIFTLAEFEPGSAVPEADVMTSEIRRQGKV